VRFLEFSPDESVLLAACDDGEIGLWSVNDGKALPSPPLNPSSPEQDRQLPPVFGPGSTRLFLNRARERQVLEVWDWSTGQLSIAYEALLGELGAFAFSPDGAMLAIAGSRQGIVLLDTKESRQIGALSVNGTMIAWLSFSPSAALLASASHDHTAKLWDVKTQRELQTLGGNDDQVHKVAFTADEKSLITQLGNGAIKLWDLPAVLGRGVLWRTTGTLRDLTVSSDTSALATANNMGEIQVWDLASGREIRRVQSGEPGQFGMSFSPTERVLAWAGNKWLGILDYASGQTNTFPIYQTGGFYSPVFSPDGRVLAFADITNIMMLDMATRKPRRFAPIDNPVLCLNISPNGALLASAHHDGAVILWDRASGLQITNILAHPPYAFDVEFSHDGRLLATGGADGIGKLWDVLPSGLKLRHMLRGHLGWMELGFSPDGQRVVSSSSDRTLKLWDARTGLEVGTLY